MKKTRLIMTFFGFLIAISGWFLDRALFFPIIRDIIAPDYMVVKQGLEILDKDLHAIIPPDHPSAKILLELWQPHPPVEVIKQISGIGRSGFYMSLVTDRNYYDLRLLIDNNKMMVSGFSWPSDEVRKLMDERLNNTVIKYSAWMFFGGLFFSSVLVIWEYYSKGT